MYYAQRLSEFTLDHDPSYFVILLIYFQMILNFFYSGYKEPSFQNHIYV